GTLDGERLEEAADRVARLRGGLARARSAAPAAGGVSSDSAGPVGAGSVGAGSVGAGSVGAGSVGAGPVGAGPGASGLGRVGPAVGLIAARRAVQVSGPRRTLSRPVIIEVEPRENIAAGRFGWGLGPWAPAGRAHRVSAAC